MSFSRMKPLPKALIIGAFVAGLVYAGVKLMPEPKPAVPAAPVETVSTPAQPAPVSPPSAPAITPPVAAVPVPAAPAPTLQPAPTNDAGLANVLGTKK